MKRLFIAIPVTLYDYPAVQSSFAPLIDGRWRDEATLHVTLAFLGERYEADTVIKRMEGIDRTFEISDIDSWGYFTASRIFFAATTNPSLQRLRDTLENNLGLSHEILVPHVTLMRVKQFKEQETFFRSIQIPPPSPLGSLQSKVVLYESIPSREGSHYHPVAKWMFHP